MVRLTTWFSCCGARWYPTAMIHATRRPRPVHAGMTVGYGRALARSSLLRCRRRGAELHARRRAAVRLAAGAEQAAPPARANPARDAAAARLARGHPDACRCAAAAAGAATARGLGRGGTDGRGGRGA